MRKLALGCALFAQLLYPVHAAASTKDFALQGYALPKDKPVTIVLMRPDVSVGELQSGGLAEPNADWTTAARANIEAALKEQLDARGIRFSNMETQLAAYTEKRRQAALAECRSKREARRAAEQAAAEQTGETAAQPVAPAEDPAASAQELLVCAELADDGGIDGEKLVTDYTGLHQAVVDAIMAHKYNYGGGKLPTKADSFDYTLGPGIAQLGAVSGANYGLFMLTNDQFASDSRKAMQVLGGLGCLIGACMIVTGGVHVAYVSLVELDTGNIVWFNLARGSEGDVREVEGAKGLVQAILAGMPTKPGERRAEAEEQAAQ